MADDGAAIFCLLFCMCVIAAILYGYIGTSAQTYIYLKDETPITDEQQVKKYKSNNNIHIGMTAAALAASIIGLISASGPGPGQKTSKFSIFCTVLLVLIHIVALVLDIILLKQDLSKTDESYRKRMKQIALVNICLKCFVFLILAGIAGETSWDNYRERKKKPAVVLASPLLQASPTPQVIPVIS